MHRYLLLFLLPLLSLALGCGSDAPAAPPTLTTDLQAQISVEDAAIEAQESQQ